MRPVEGLRRWNYNWTDSFLSFVLTHQHHCKSLDAPFISKSEKQVVCRLVRSRQSWIPGCNLTEVQQGGFNQLSAVISLILSSARRSVSETETDSLSLQDTFIFKRKKKEKWADNRMFSHRSNLLVCVVSLSHTMKLSRGKEVKVEAATEDQQWLNRSGLKGLLLRSTFPILCIFIREKSLKYYVHRLRTQPHLLYAHVRLVHNGWRNVSLQGDKGRLSMNFFSFFSDFWILIFVFVICSIFPTTNETKTKGK